MGIPVIVPLKALGDAKSRLAGAVDAECRRALVADMLATVVAACLDCPHVDTVLVAAGDDAAASVARRTGADAVVVREPGIDVAVNAAQAVLGAATATLTVAADLALATSADVTAVIDAAPTAGWSVVVAPTVDGGTAALLRTPSAVIAPAYGPGSAARHLHAARAVGAAAVRVDLPGLALDVDTPEQLSAALAGGFTPRVGCRPY